MDQETKSVHSGHEASVLTRLVDLIERNASDLTNNWLTQVRRDVSLHGYQRLDNSELYNRAYRVYSHLGKWISRETTKEEIARDYIALGAQRRKEGFALSEVIQALFLARYFKSPDDGTDAS
mgnify:CR=1 FL=1